MTLKHITLAGILTVAGLFSTNRSVDAASFHHIDRLAVDIQRQSSELYREFRIHYRHTADGRHLMADARDLFHRAKHIHDVAHNHGSVRHLARDLAKIDRSFHHIQRLLTRNELDAGVHGIGHVHGATGHVHRLMRSLERNIHHMREDVNEMLEVDQCNYRLTRRVPNHGRYIGGRSFPVAPVSGFQIPGTGLSFSIGW